MCVYVCVFIFGCYIIVLAIDVVDFTISSISPTQPPNHLLFLFFQQIYFTFSLYNFHMGLLYSFLSHSYPSTFSPLSQSLLQYRLFLKFHITVHAFEYIRSIALHTHTYVMCIVYMFHFTHTQNNHQYMVSFFSPFISVFLRVHCTVVRTINVIYFFITFNTSM